MKGEAPILVSTHLDLMNIATAMQVACINDNAKEKGVLKAFRMGGWTAYRPTPSGLRPALGSAYGDFPLGSRRLSEKLIGQRFDWVDQAGLPIRPDWSELTAVRRRKTVGFGRKKKAAGSERRKEMADAKADLDKRAARVSSALALLRDSVASDQKAAQAVSAGETSSSLEPSAHAKRELREVSNKLAMRALALKGVAERLESQKQALEASTNASAKHIARVRQNFAKAIRNAQETSKRVIHHQNA